MSKKELRDRDPSHHFRLTLGRCLMGCLLVALIGQSLSAGTYGYKSRPNIVFILIDDLRHDTFGFADHPFIKTPNLDALAASGIHFRNAFVTTSLCSPARASFLTGQYMHRHRVVDNSDRMSERNTTFPMLLQESGYETAFIGKWHMGGASDEPRKGFDHWVSFRGQGTYAPQNQNLNVNGTLVPRRSYMTDELTEYAVDWLSEQEPDQPFMLYLSHKGVHGLYDPAERHRDVYKNVDIELPTSMARSELQLANKPMWVQDQRNSWHGVEFAYYGRSMQSIAEMYQHYCEMILSIDDSVGEVVAELNRKEMLENTLIVFTSDGGHLWGEHGLIDKRCAYEPSIRIPLLVSMPGMTSQDVTCDALVSNIDIAPTFLELAGVESPPTLDGASLLQLFRDPSDTDEWRKEILYEYYWEPSFPQTPTIFCLRGERYKFIQYHGVWDRDEFYDLKTDPHEEHNLIDDEGHRAIVSDHRRQLYERLKETDGLTIPLGFKRNQGSNERRADGTSRSEFPAQMIRQ